MVHQWWLNDLNRRLHPSTQVRWGEVMPKHLMCGPSSTLQWGITWALTQTQVLSIRFFTDQVESILESHFKSLFIEACNSRCRKDHLGWYDNFGVKCQAELLSSQIGFRCCSRGSQNPPMIIFFSPSRMTRLVILARPLVWRWATELNPNWILLD